MEKINPNLDKIGWEILYLISKNPNINTKEISKSIGLTYANTHIRIKNMIGKKEGLLEKEIIPNPNNFNRGLATRFKLTDEAKYFILLMEMFAELPFDLVLGNLKKNPIQPKKQIEQMDLNKIEWDKKIKKITENLKFSMEKN